MINIQTNIIDYHGKKIHLYRDLYLTIYKHSPNYINYICNFKYDIYVYSWDMDNLLKLLNKNICNVLDYYIFKNGEYNYLNHDRKKFLNNVLNIKNANGYDDLLLQDESTVIKNWLYILNDYSKSTITFNYF